MSPASDDGAAARPASADAFSIEISNQQQALPVDADRLQQIARSVLHHEQVSSARISVAVVDDPTIHDINRRFLQHDYPTDVISFLLNDEPPPGLPTEPPGGPGPHSPIDGEVLLSGETAVRAAGEVGWPAEHELALYLIHGLLHLCGYDDHSDADRAQMRQREHWHLQKSGIPAHYEY